MTRAISNKHTKTRKAIIQKSAWFEKVHKIYYPTSDQTVAFNYLDKNAILLNPGLLDKIPSPSIINLVRQNWMIGDKPISDYTGTDIVVSHQGFAIRKNGVLLFRHASSSKSTMAVTEEPLIDYLRRLEDNSSYVGINILQIQK